MNLRQTSSGKKKTKQIKIKEVEVEMMNLLEMHIQ
jgi:hypothetical protein